MNIKETIQKKKEKKNLSQIKEENIGYKLLQFMNLDLKSKTKRGKKGDGEIN